MKPTREEILKLWDELPVTTMFGSEKVEALFLTAYSLGQEEMRERADEAWSQAVQSNCENGVRYTNKIEADYLRKRYPELANLGATLRAKLAECEKERDEHRDLHGHFYNKFYDAVAQLTECENKLAESAMQELSTLAQNEDLYQRLQESQAREAKLRGWIMDCGIVSEEDPINYAISSLGQSDDSALREAIKKAKREALMDAAEWFDDGFEYSAANNTARELRHMAEEIK